MSLVTKGVYNLIGDSTSATSGDETISLSLNGATATATTTIPAKKRMTITDVWCSGSAGVIWKVQESVDGGTTFFTVATFETANSATSATGSQRLGTPFALGIGGTGGGLVKVLASSPAGSGARELITLRGAFEPVE